MTTTTTLRHKVAIIGSGNWGSTIAKVVAENTAANPELFEPEVRMWVFDEMVEVPSTSKHYRADKDYCNGPQPLSALVNQLHENIKYLPDIALPANVVADPSIVNTVAGASILVFNLPHQFLRRACADIKGKIKPYARAVSCIKGVEIDEDEIRLLPDVISQSLGIYCGVLSGANIATEVALERFSDTTIAYHPPAVDLQRSGVVASPDSDETDAPPPVADLTPVPEQYPAMTKSVIKSVFQRPYFMVEMVSDVASVSLGGALKNIIALAAGFVVGLGWGDNGKSVVIRLGLEEMVRFVQIFFSDRYLVRERTLTLGSCGVGDVSTSCASGRNFRCGRKAVEEGKTVAQVESEMLNGQKLQGTSTAQEVNAFLRKQNREQEFPLMTTVYNILEGNAKPEDIPVLVQPRL